MVYEVKCSECGKVLDFGGREREKLPDGAMKFDDNIYCRECVKQFVRFGSGDVLDKVDDLEEKLDSLLYEMGMEDKV